MPSSVLSLIKTTQEKRLLEEELTILKQSLYQKDSNFKSQLTQLRPSFANAILKDLSNTNSDPENYLDSLITDLDKIPILELTLAIEPTLKVIDRLQDWTTQNLTYPVLLDIKVNPRIIAGVIIVFNGEYHDLSAKLKLKQYLSSHKTELIKSLK